MSTSKLPLLPLASLILFAACSGTGAGRDGDLDAKLGVRIPRSGFVMVSEDLRVEPGDYLRSVEDGEGLIVLEGLRNTQVDLRGVVLRGTTPRAGADEGRGCAVLVRDCEGIEILGGTFRGYRVGILVERSDGVRIEGSVFDPVHGQRLSGAGSASDPYTNLQLDLDAPESALDGGGAAIAIVDSSRVEIRDVTARGGQNGLLLIRSENCALEDNDLSFLSGFGIALQASDHNTLLRNRCDGVTRRSRGGRTEPDHGATGILLCAGSSDNLIGGNLARGATAGLRELAVNGTGSRNNRYVANDLSGSSRVAAEFRGSSGAWFVNNEIKGAGGCALRVEDSLDMAFCNNRIESILGAGIQLNGGRRAILRANRFVDCDTAIEIEGGDEALEHWIGQNHFAANIQDLVLEHALGLEFSQNDFEPGAGRAHIDGLSGAGDPQLQGQEVWSWLEDAEGHLPSGRSSNSELRWPSLRVPTELAPVAAWQGSPEAALTRPDSAAPGEIEMGQFAPLDPERSRPRSRAQRSTGRLDGVQWQGSWFTWDQDSDPRGAIERWRARRFEPLVRAEFEDWINPWASDRQVQAQLPETHFGLIASGTLLIETPGEYLLSVIADDGVRILIDGEVLLEDWAWHPERRRSEKIELAAGSHPMEVEYFQIDGTAVLSLDLQGPAGP